MNDEEYSVYTLRYPIKHPQALSVFYVGMAANPYKRFIQHLQLEGENGEKTATLTELREKWSPPIMHIEHICTTKELASRLEACTIEYYRAAKQPLVNKVLSLSEDAQDGRRVYEYEQSLQALFLQNFDPVSLWLTRLFSWMPGNRKRAKRLLQWHTENYQYYLAILNRVYPYPVFTMVNERMRITCRVCQEVLIKPDKNKEIRFSPCKCAARKEA